MAKKSTKTKVLSPFDQVDSFFKRSVWTVVLDSLATIVLGILLVVWPEIIIQILAYIVGIFFIVKGAFFIVNYFAAKGHRDFYNNDLLNGVIEALIGIALFVLGPTNVSVIFRVVVGIWIIYGGLVRANIALKLSVAKTRDWVYLMLIGLLMIVLGFIIIFIEGSIVSMVGGILIACGLVSIIGDTIFVIHLEDLKKKINGIIKK